MNEDTIHVALTVDDAKWHQLCSSMDVIEDTESAIIAFESSDDKTSAGDRYLSIYGLLQALFVQQDAVSHFCDSVGYGWTPKDTPRVHEIRELRNDCIGHPTRRTKSKCHSYHHIVQVSMTLYGFDLLSFDSGKMTKRTVRLGGIIRDQREALLDVLSRAISSLQELDAAKRRRFMKDPLASAFPPTLGYYFSKIIGGTQGWSSKELGKVHMPILTDCTSKFVDKLIQRGLTTDTYPGIKVVIDEIEYPLRKLTEYYDEAGGAECIDDATAYIFADFLNRRFDQLNQMAREIDEETGRGLSEATGS